MQWNEQGDQAVGSWTQSSKTASLPQNKAAILRKLISSMKLLHLVPQPALTLLSQPMLTHKISKKILVSHQRKLGLIGETGRITGPTSWLMRVGSWEWGMVTCSLAIHPWLYDVVCIYVVLIMLVVGVTTLIVMCSSDLQWCLFGLLVIKWPVNLISLYTDW